VKGLTRDSEVDVVVLVVAPPALASREGKRADLRPVPASVEALLELRVEEDAVNPNVVGPCSTVEGGQMKRDGIEVNNELIGHAAAAELEVIAPAVEKRGWNGYRPTLPVAHGNEEVDGKAVLMRLVRLELTTASETGLTVHEPEIGSRGCQLLEGVGKDSSDRTVDIGTACRDAQGAIGREVGTVSRKLTAVAELAMIWSAEAEAGGVGRCGQQSHEDCGSCAVLDDHGRLLWRLTDVEFSGGRAGRRPDLTSAETTC
jgi:hypothetical protein